jgi:CubicO group peptidase (beta-lactamase class C family)
VARCNALLRTSRDGLRRSVRPGLPRLPSNFKPKDPSNPYADCTVEQLYQFLSSYELPRDVDSQVEYSNLGIGLLGHALERRAGEDYESLVRRRILVQLGMNSTCIALSPDMKARLASEHNGKLEGVGNWDVTTLAGAGALRSTANDMLTFLAANDSGAPEVVILNETAARRFWPGEDPLGKRITNNTRGPGGREARTMTVVGVARDGWRSPVRICPCSRRKRWTTTRRSGSSRYG